MIKYNWFELNSFSAWMSIFDYVHYRGKIGFDNGIHFTIHPKENGHNVPHLHASYQNQEVVLSIEDGSVLSGNLPPKKLKIAKQWVQSHQDEIENHWNELVEGIGYYGLTDVRKNILGGFRVDVLGCADLVPRNWTGNCQAEVNLHNVLYQAQKVRFVCQKESPIPLSSSQRWSWRRFLVTRPSMKLLKNTVLMLISSEDGKL